MEACGSYKPWHDKKSGKTFLKGSQSKCLHYYFYFIDQYLGYGYIRVPTWCPFKLQVYVNGHNILANELRAQGIGFSMLDNAFDHIEDFEKAQEISDNLDMAKIHGRLDEPAKTYCPVFSSFNQVYHWSIPDTLRYRDRLCRQNMPLILSSGTGNTCKGFIRNLSQQPSIR